MMTCMSYHVACLQGNVPHKISENQEPLVAQINVATCFLACMLARISPVGKASSSTKSNSDRKKSLVHIYGLKDRQDDGGVYLHCQATVSALSGAGLKSDLPFCLCSS